MFATVGFHPGDLSSVASALTSPPRANPLLGAWPRTSVQLGALRWAAIARIAGLRVGVNNSMRLAHRSRGKEKNILNDIQGCAGEIISLLALHDNPLAGDVRYLALSFNDPGNGDPDIVTTLDGHPFRAETKCLLMDPKKKYFLVNRQAHQKSIDRGADYYLPVLTSIGCGVAMVGRPIPIAEVGRWKAMEFEYGDTALGIPLEKFCPGYFGMSPRELCSRWDDAGFIESMDSLRAKADAAVAALPRLRRNEKEDWREMPVGRLLKKVGELFP